MVKAVIGSMILLVSVTALAGCEEGTNPFTRRTEAGQAAPAAAASTSTRLVERDVEAPQVFQATDSALWDGRPSLGGVWVASTRATDPERVILRNPGNGKFVIGALFRRERDNPGPSLQISSDAAAALGMLAGQPATISVTALRREEVPAAPATGAAPILDSPEAVETTTLAAAPTASTAATGSPARGTAPASAAAPGAKPAAAAPATTATGSAATTPARTPATPAPAAAPAPATAGRTVQIGIFSVEANAKRAVDALAKGGVTATSRKGESHGKAFWSVTASGADLTKVKGLGFADAYLLR